MSTNDPVQIGPYRILAELGHGAMGKVVLGAGPDGRLVAVKLVREWLAQDEQFRARFRREVAASQRISGPYTAAVLSAGPDDPIPWLASEFLPGPTLRDAVDETGALPEDTVLRLAAGLASALAAIHQAGLIHRDLKPGNVILTDTGPRVIDFGIARAAESADLTRTGGVVGTPGFMSPEQAESRPLTAASDVFSLGSVLVAACTGASPFAAESTLATLNNVVRAEPDLSGVPDRLRPIVERCLAREAADRATPAELLELIGPIPPTDRVWPDAVASLADRQSRAFSMLLNGTGEHTTLIDNGRTMVAGPHPPGFPVPMPPHPVGPPYPPGLPGPRRSAPPDTVATTAMILCTVASLGMVLSIVGFLLFSRGSVSAPVPPEVGALANLVWGAGDILVIIGTILMWTRRPAGRTVAIIGFGLALAPMLMFEIAAWSAPGVGSVSAWAYLLTATAVSGLVSVLLPRTGRSLRAPGHGPVPQQPAGPPPPYGAAPVGPVPQRWVPWTVGAVLAAVMVVVGSLWLFPQSPPDSITYEITGTSPEPLHVSYTGSDGEDIEVTVDRLPWSATVAPAPDFVGFFALNPSIYEDADLTLRLKRGNEVLKTCEGGGPCLMPFPSD